MGNEENGGRYLKLKMGGFMQLQTKTKLQDHLLPVIKEDFHLPETVKTEDLENRLTRLGLKSAGEIVDRVKKMQVAFQHYAFLPQEKVNLFNEKLRQETLEEDKNARHFKQLIFTRIEDYDKIPPAHVLDAIEQAQKDNVFDFYEVAHIRWIHEIKDPIVFGRINGCKDRFFIAQWDNDISIEELLAQK